VIDTDMLTETGRFIENKFLIIALIMSATALIFPPLFTWLKPHIPIALGIIMFGMGLTLDFSDFKGILCKWRLVLLGVVLQYTIMPLLGVGAAFICGLPIQAALGLVLVGACPGGTASNVITYLAKGNVALSVVMTFCSTILAPLATPAIVYFLYETKINIEFWPMVTSIFWIVAFPLVDGLVCRKLFRKHIQPFLDIFPSISILTIGLVIACVMGLNQATILAFPIFIILAVLIHNLGGFALGYGAAKLFKADARDARTVAIEVGMQNSGLGVALANTFFSQQAALPGAIFSLEQNLVGISLAKFWTRK
jgi:BASS family bile acid:Na+ symporter